jgi:glycine betaine/proline transport system substrate-binding protein
VKFGGKLLVLALVLVAGAVVAGCGGGEGSVEGSAEGSAPGEGKTLELGYIEWDENVANSNLIKIIAEEDLGYEEVELQLADVGPVFQGVAGGDTDAFLDA